MVDSYRLITSNNPTSFVAFDNEFTYKFEGILDVCHARLKRVAPKKCDQIITAVAKSQSLDIEYIKWLIAGPFRSFADRIGLETVNHEEKQLYYLRLTNLDTWPSNVVYNFCIATRTSIEFPYLIKIWGQLLEAGVDIGLAYIIASKCNYYGLHYEGDPWGWKLPGLHGHTGHFWFDPTSSWRSILSGEPVTKAFTNYYKAHPDEGIPANVIWGNGAKEGIKNLPDKTVKEISDLFGFTKSEPAAEYKVMVDDFKIDDDDDDEDDDDDDEVFFEDVIDEDGNF